MARSRMAGSGHLAASRGTWARRRCRVDSLGPPSGLYQSFRELCDAPSCTRPPLASIRMARARQDKSARPFRDQAWACSVSRSSGVTMKREVVDGITPLYE